MAIHNGAAASRSSTTRRRLIASSALWLAFGTVKSARGEKAAGRAVQCFLNGPADFSLAGPIVAGKLGLFNGAGLDLELVPGSSDAQAVDSVLANENAVGLTSAIAFLEARASGKPIVAFSASYVQSGGLFYARSNSRIYSPNDFEGKTVNYRRGTDTSLLYDLMLGNRNVNRSAIREVEEPLSINSLIEGKVDILPGHVGIEAREFARRGLAYATVDPRRFGVHLLGSVYFCAEKAIKQNRQTLVSLVQVISAGWEQAYQDYAVTVPMLLGSDFPKWELGYLKSAMDQQRDYVRPAAARPGDYDRSMWTDLYRVMLQMGVIKDTVDISRAVSFDILNDAHRPRSSLK
jgi:NitT/TauT family transport system substrate-binding protein